MAICITAAGVVLVNLNVHGELPAGWYWGGHHALIGLAAHLVIRWRTPYADPLLFPLIYVLNGLGLVMIHRLDLGTRPVMHSAELQLTWTAIAVAVFAAVLILLKDHRVLQRFPYLTFLAGMLILMMPLLPVIGFENHGARIWIKVGPYSFQPAELAKIVLTVAFASYLVEKKDVLALAGARFLGIDLPRPRDLGPIIVMWLASLAVLIYQKGPGHVACCSSVLFVMMLYVATERLELARSWAHCCSWPVRSWGYLTYPFFAHVQTGVSVFGSTRSRTGTPTTSSSRASSEWRGVVCSAPAWAWAGPT